MAKHNIGLLIAMAAALIIFIITMAFSALAAAGSSPFLYDTGNISAQFVIQITPSGWTFTIWTIIYIFLALVMAYAISGIFRKNAYGYVYCSPAVLPYGFYAFWCLNLVLNISWLFLWDRMFMPAALAFLILIALTNYAVIFFSCYGLSQYGAWLNKYHRVDLWLHRVLIQNGIAIYATWTTIASLVNLTIVLVYDANVSNTDGATISLSILTVAVVAWFVLENFVLDKHVRFILTIYPVVIWALTGVFTENYNAADPTRNNIFIAALLGIACFLFVARILLFTWRQIKMPLYKDVNPDDMSPMDIAEKQKKMFR
ncbi:uncharacterized protein LOC105938417 [Fundulus heteroclitus]|uniref:uncharacterized protein LOC105938417 n=1 Tax=Fundulus heteroclitus TaxID=8078 RepID=UPI00079FA9A4|nr:uncharacterized protein LOC105938417 [Fundulus heteroclitus]